MKKLMFALVAAGAAAVMGDAIESANTVGYTSFDTTAGKWVIVGTQFEKAGAASGTSISIQDFIVPSVASGTLTCADADESESTWSAGPQIQTLNADGKNYTRYFYSSNAYWYDEKDQEQQSPGWISYDSAGDMEDAEVDPGMAFWFIQNNASPTTVKITVNGQVATADTGFTTTAGKWKLATIPYPNGIALNSDKITWENMDACSADESESTWSTGTQIQTLQSDGKNYSRYFYASDAYWYDKEEQEHQSPGWISYDSAGDMEDVELEQSKGFWVWSPTKGITCTFTP